VSSLPSAMAVVGDSIGLSTVEVASILFPLLAIPKLMLRHASESDSLVVPSVVGSLLSSLRAGHGRERERERESEEGPTNQGGGERHADWCACGERKECRPWWWHE
jgi:hypothetical protein